MSTPRSSLTVCIAGGGISALVAAAFLSREKFNVVVIERRPEYVDTSIGGGVDLTANATACIEALGLKEEFAKIADIKTRVSVRKGGDGAQILSMPDGGHAMVHRGDLMVMLKDHVQGLGAKVLWGESVESIEEGDEKVNVVLRSGMIMEADVLIGADGISSVVRKHMYPDKEYDLTPTSHSTFLVDVPEAFMKKHSSTSSLFESSKDSMNLWLGPSRSIVDWTMTKRNNYHLQVNDHVFGDGEAYGIQGTFDGTQYATKFDNMALLRKRFDDFSEAIRRILAETRQCTLWRTAELPDLPSWSSSSARVIIIGDAAHNFPPYAGQGAAMAIEDAAVLATLLTRTKNVKVAAKTYERLRRPRVDGCRAVVRANMSTFTLENIEDQFPPLRMTMSNEVKGDEGTGDATIEKLLTMHDYDAVGEATNCDLAE